MARAHAYASCNQGCMRLDIEPSSLMYAHFCRSPEGPEAGARSIAPHSPGLPWGKSVYRRPRADSSSLTCVCVFVCLCVCVRVCVCACVCVSVSVGGGDSRLPRALDVLLFDTCVFCCMSRRHTCSSVAEAASSRYGGAPVHGHHGQGGELMVLTHPAPCALQPCPMRSHAQNVPDQGA